MNYLVNAGAVVILAAMFAFAAWTGEPNDNPKSLFYLFALLILLFSPLIFAP